MTKRLVLGTVAAALAFGLAPRPASANHIACTEEFWAVCYAIDTAGDRLCRKPFWICH